MARRRGHPRSNEGDQNGDERNDPSDEPEDGEGQSEDSDEVEEGGFMPLVNSDGAAPAPRAGPVTRDELRRLQTAPGATTTVAIERPSWLSPTGVDGVFAGEDGIELPGDGGDVIPPIGSGGMALKPPVKDFDAWMAKLEPFFSEYPGLYKLQVYRKSPVTTSEGIYCEGVCGEFHHVISTGFIQENFGGHKYDIRLQGPAKNDRGEVVNKMAYLSTFHGLKIAGPARIDSQVADGLLKNGPNDTRNIPERKRAHLAEQLRAATRATEEAQKPPPPPPPPPPQSLESKLAQDLVKANIDRTERLEDELRSMRTQASESPQQPVQPTRNDGSSEAIKLLLAQNTQMQQALFNLLQNKNDSTPPPPPPTDATKDAVLLEAIRMLGASKNQPPPAPPPTPVSPIDKDELDRLHGLVDTLQSDIRKLHEDRRTEIGELTRRARDDADAMRKQYETQIDEMRRKSRDELSDARTEARQQTEDRVASVRQQYEDLLKTVREAAEERVRIIQQQLDDWRNQATDTRGKLASAEAEAQKARLDEIAAKTEAKIAAVQAKSVPANEGGVSGVVKTVREMREAMELINPGSTAPAAAAEPAKPSVTDRVLNVAEAVAKNERGAELLEKILSRFGRQGQAQPAQNPPAQSGQPSQPGQPPAPAQPTQQQVDEAQRAWAVELERQRQAEQAKRNAARAQQPPRYAVADGTRFETLENEPVEDGLPQAPPKAPPQPAPQVQPPAEPSDAEIAEAMTPTVEGTLAMIEEAALENTPPGECVDAILKSTMGMTRAEALGIFAGLDPRKSLAEIGITRDQLSMAGGVYFDSVITYMEQLLGTNAPAPQ